MRIEIFINETFTLFLFNYFFIYLFNRVCMNNNNNDDANN